MKNDPLIHIRALRQKLAKTLEGRGSYSSALLVQQWRRELAKLTELKIVENTNG